MSYDLNSNNQLAQNNNTYLLQNPLNFISAGVACYAFVLIDELGLLEQLLSNKGLSPDCFRSYPNPLIVRTAIQTLECNDIIFFNDSVFQLTSFGISLMEHRSSIGLIYNGYCKVLADQIRIAKDQPIQYKNISDLVDDKAISRAASHMGSNFFNQQLLKILENYSIKGTICDLGCGNASTLISLCKKMKLNGLGFDFSDSSIEEAKKNLSDHENVTLLVKDICDIRDVYQDVEVLIQSFVMHDFSDIVCKKMLTSFRKCFPHTKLFIYIDAVSPEDGSHSQLPGFDYIHSLFGIKPRTFKETLTLFIESGFQVLDQKPIIGLINCYVWTLSPFE